MEAEGSGLERAGPDRCTDEARTIADLFARVGTDPMLDWADPAVLLTHPLQRATIQPYDRGHGLGRAVYLARTLWTATDRSEAKAITRAAQEIEPDPWARIDVEQVDESRWEAGASQVVELEAGHFELEHLTWVQASLERAVDRALPRLAAAVRPVLGRVARPRARLLRHALRLLGDGAAEGSIGEPVALAAVGSEYVTLASGFERLPVFVHLVAAVDRLEVLTLLAGFDGRSTRRELLAVGRAAAVHARRRDDLRVVDVPGELGMAVGVVSQLPGTAATAAVRGVMEAHLDVARAVAWVGVGAGARA